MYTSKVLDNNSTLSAKCVVYIDFQKQKTRLFLFQEQT